MPADNLVGPDPTGISDDNLLSLARQAGIINDAPSGAMGDAGAAVAPPPSVAGELTQGMGFSPTSETPPAGSSGKSSSSSSQGFSISASAKVDAYVDPALKRQFATADAEGAASMAPAIDAEKTAQTSGKAAVQGVIGAEHNDIVAEGREARIMGDFLNTQAAEEAKINESYRAESNKAKADYMVALTDFRGSRVDPSALWKQMGPGNQFGMLVSAFVQDFLGVQGIHVSAMDTFNKAVDRNIDAQVLAIKTKGEVAQGFKNLWEMQRQQSASDTEARQRVRGFMLDGAKQAVVAHMSQYKAALSDAQGQSALAKIDEEFAKNLVDVYKHIDQSTIQRREQAIQVFGEKLKASMESQKIASAERIAKMEHPPVIGGATEGMLVDPYTKKYSYKLTDSYLAMKPDERAKVQEKAQQNLNASATINSKFEALRSFARDMKSLPSDKLRDTRFMDTQQQKYDFLKQDLAQSITRDTDGRVNWNEIQGQGKGMPDKLIGAQYDLDEVVAEKQKFALQKTHDLNRGIIEDLPKDHPARNITSDIGGGIDAAQKAAAAGASPIAPTHDEIMVREAAKQADSAYLPMQTPLKPEEVGADTKEVVSEFKKEHPDAYNKTRVVPGEGPDKPGVGDQILPWEPGMKHLMDMAKEGGKNGDDAYQKLLDHASKYLGPTGNEDSPSESIFAAMLLHKLHTDDPDRFKEPVKDH